MPEEQPNPTTAELYPLRWWTRFTVVPVAVAIIGGLVAVAGGYFFSQRFAQNANAHENQRRQAQDQIRDMRTSALGLKGIYESIVDINKPSSSAIRKVRAQAPKIAKQLESIPDPNLSENYQIIKYGYIGMLYVIAGQVEPNKAELEIFGKSAIGALDKGIELAGKLEIKAKDDADYFDSLQWLIDGDYKNWLIYNRAIAEALLAEAGEKTTWFEIESQLKLLPGTYLEDAPVLQNPALTWACLNFPNAQSSHFCKEP